MELTESNGRSQISHLEPIQITGQEKAVIPAEAGIQAVNHSRKKAENLDPRFRGDDDQGYSDRLLDHFVGKVVGDVFSVVADNSALDHMCLLPALTFKVRSRLCRNSPIRNTLEHIQRLAGELRADVEATLGFFEYGQEYIDYLGPELETVLAGTLKRVILEDDPPPRIPR